MPVSLENQVVLVIGASSGIGRETAALFAREGAFVMASARREDRLQQLQAEAASEGHVIEIAPADSSKAAAMAELAKRTRDRFGTIDIVVNLTPPAAHAS